MKLATFLGIFVVIACVAFQEINGHGYMIDPPNRSSRWRFNKSAPINWDDDQLYCGSFGTQWDTYGGRCGVCGDSFGDAHPQENENTGTYGNGVVVKEYKSGSTIEVGIVLTTNHWGYFNYSVCILQDPSKPETGEECFTDLKLSDNTYKYKVKTGESKIKNQLVLPSGLTCDRCVLRWTYTGGENWGQCPDGSYAQGCGPQETFRSCADVRIV